MAASPEKILFLPGASGNTRFWHPVAESLEAPKTAHHLGWPGFGDTPPAPNITRLSDLASLALAEINRPTDAGTAAV